MKTIWNIDGFDDVNCSEQDKRWRCLVHLTDLLSEGKELEELIKEVENANQEAVIHKPQSEGKELEESIREIENPNPEAVIHHPLDHGFLRKDKQSPRKKKIYVKHVVPMDVDGGLKIKKNLEKRPILNCTQETALKFKITMKKPIEGSPEASTCGISKIVQKTPLSICKRRIASCEDEEGIDEKRARRITIKMEDPNPRPNLPEEFKNRILEIGGCLENVVLVIQKGLFQTDVSTGHNRLSVPYSKVENPFLTSWERYQLDFPKAEIMATLVQPCLEECQISLRYWNTNSMYALVKSWNDVWEKNGLKQGMIIQLWSFRKNISELCFALVRVD